MQYIKALIGVVFFFLAMLFLCQNQTVLSEEVTLQCNLLFQPEVLSFKTPFYFVVLAAFLFGLVCCFLLLAWERMRISASSVRIGWKVRRVEKDQLLMVEELRKVAKAPLEERAALLEEIKTLYEARKKSRQDEDKDKDSIAEVAIKATASEIPPQKPAAA